MESLADLLALYGKTHPQYARGGLQALSGFDFQLRAYLADFAEHLAQSSQVGNAGDIFLEALSDYTREEEDKVVCVQVKRSLNRQSLRKAAEEFLLIDEFLETHASETRAGYQFEVVAQFIEPGLTPAAVWEHLEFPSDAGKDLRFKRLLQAGRLRPARIESDPWWRIIAAVFPVLDDPFAFAYEALGAGLSRGAANQDASRIRDSIVASFAKHLRPQVTLPGNFITSADVTSRETGSRSIVLGDVATIADLRDGRFMDRAEKLTDAVRYLNAHLDADEAFSAIPAFWITGRSGCGKSVLLLQLMRNLVLNHMPVIWLDDDSEGFVDLLKAWVHNPPQSDTTWFVVVDDFNAPHKRGIDFEGIGRLVRNNPDVRWPILLTCGPSEQFEEFTASGHDEGFRLSSWMLSTVGSAEKDQLRGWFEDRTGQSPLTGDAFEQDEGLILSMLFEMQHGEMRQFAARFRRRLEDENLVETLAQPLALNRLYIWAPKSWFSEAEEDALRRINRDNDFSILTTSDPSTSYLRLTHPHLSDSIYRGIRSRGDGIVFARDLARAFERALTSDPGVAFQILQSVSEETERLDIVDFADLAKRMTAAWKNQNEIEASFLTSVLPHVWVCWARWAARQPEIEEHLGVSPLERTRRLLDPEDSYWDIVWLQLWSFAQGHEGLFDDARLWLKSTLDFPSRNWSRVWSEFLGFGYESDAINEGDINEIALPWLKANQSDPAWLYVFTSVVDTFGQFAPWQDAVELVTKLPNSACWSHTWQALLERTSLLPPGTTVESLVKLGVSWLPSREDHPSWSHVWRGLLERSSALPPGTSVKILVELGVSWLASREDRPEWAFVWGALLERRSVLPPGTSIKDLVQLGVLWLASREDRPEWSYVWRALLERSSALPPDTSIERLIQIGVEWLPTREDLLGWSFVWRTLLDHGSVLPPGVSTANLVRLGIDWLPSREDQTGWSNVWEALLEHASDLPPDTSVESLIQLGIDWLSSRKDRPDWDFVWRALLQHDNALPTGTSVESILQFGIDWLPTHEDLTGWSNVWEALLERDSVLPPSIPIERLIRLGIAWLRSHVDRPDWNFVWRALLARANELPPDTPIESLVQLGVDWLPYREDRPEWAYVWNSLLDQGSALPPGVSITTLVQRGIDWLSFHEDHPSWAHILRALLERSRALPPNTSIKSLIQIGISWLCAREDRPEWAFVWEALRKQGSGLSLDNSVEALVQLGVAWLPSRDDHPGWTLVWKALLEHASILPPGTSVEGLVQIGVAWLPSREDHPGWNLVWQALLERSSALPPTTSVESLVQLGVDWLASREDQIGWTHVWEALLQRNSVLPSSTSTENLVQQGIDWLTSREDRPEWAFVWKALLDRGSALPSGTSVESLVQLGDDWLSSREDRPEWAHVWRALLERDSALPPGASIDDLVQFGVDWLSSREDRPEWAHVWRALLERHSSLPPETSVETLIQTGLSWLHTHEDHMEWSRVWEALLKQQVILPPDGYAAHLIELGLDWLPSRENRSDWAFVWRALLERGSTLPSGTSIQSLLQLGIDWLPSRKDRSDWSHIWEALVKWESDLPTETSVESLVQLGINWLHTHWDRLDWSHVWETCLRFYDGQQRDLYAHLALGVEWLRRAQADASWSFVYIKAVDHLHVLPDLRVDLYSLGVGWLTTHWQHPSWSFILKCVWEIEPNEEVARLVIRWVDQQATGKVNTGALNLMVNIILESTSPEIYYLIYDWYMDNRDKAWSYAVGNAIYPPRRSAN